jgi:hypothetical protein
MSLARQFQTAVTDAVAQGGTTADLLPMVFAQAAVHVLPVDGAGLSMTDHLRIPIAASDQHVVTAERLQTTIGEGPCLAAVAGRKPLVADLAVIAARWPTFHEGFVAQTPYQSVAAFPLRSVQGSCLGALDLYSTNPEAFNSLELAAVDAAVAVPIASMLFTDAAAGELNGIIFPSWLTREQVDERMNVWVAIGMLMARQPLSNDDALALLRGYAYSHNLTLDQVARQMTDRGLEPDALLV